MENMESALRTLLANLTEQERDALERTCTGADYPALARDLGINRWTFKSRVRRAHAKIGVNTRLEAMVLLRAGEIAARVLTPGTAARFGLFEREAQVLALICKGLRRPAIARELVVEEGTVAAHINSICAKVGAHNCVEIIARMIGAADPGWEPPAP
jgi:DNA-binding CsgD family transcriptional regulator